MDRITRSNAGKKIARQVFDTVLSREKASLLVDFVARAAAATPILIRHAADESAQTRAPIVAVQHLPGAGEGFLREEEIDKLSASIIAAVTRQSGGVLRT